MTATHPLVTATVTDRTRAEEIRLDVTGAPPIEVRDLGVETFYPTGLRIAYDGTETKSITILTTTDDLSVRFDASAEELAEDPIKPWVTALVDEHRPDPRETDRARRWAAVAEIVDRARSKGVTELDTDTIAEALGLDEEDDREPDVDGAGRTRAEYEDAPAERHNFLAENLGEAEAKRRLPNCAECHAPATAPAHDDDHSPETLHLRALLNA